MATNIKRVNQFWKKFGTSWSKFYRFGLVSVRSTRYAHVWFEGDAIIIVRYKSHTWPVNFISIDRWFKYL